MEESASNVTAPGSDGEVARYWKVWVNHRFLQGERGESSG